MSIIFLLYFFLHTLLKQKMKKYIILIMNKAQAEVS